MDKRPDLYTHVINTILQDKGMTTGYVAMKARSMWSRKGNVKIRGDEKKDIEERSFWCQPKEMLPPTTDEQQRWFGKVG